MLKDPGTSEAVHVPRVRARERGLWDPSQEGKGLFVYPAGVPISGMLSYHGPGIHRGATNSCCLDDQRG